MGANRLLNAARWMAVCVGLCVASDPAGAQQSPTRVEQLVGFEVLDGGHWRQDNADASSENAAPAYWVRQVGWGPGRDVVVADAFAVYQDGRCESVAHMVYYWDHGNSRVGLRSFSSGGVVGEGHVVALGPDRNQLTVSVWLSDGSEMRMRDTADLSRPGEYSARAESWVDGEWVAGDAAVWRMNPAPSPCEGS